jgi:ribose-phosphate pyrophosphokinase
MRRIINLVKPVPTGTTYILGYKISRFPDGQQGITLDEGWLNPDHEFEIISRLNNFLDLELILCTTAALKSAGVKDIFLTVPYFMGARSDRKFGAGGYHYLKEVIGPIINLQGYRSVAVLDPHSDVLEACIDRLSPNSNLAFVKWALADLGYKEDPTSFVFVAPDAGAYKKVDSLVRELQHRGHMITAHKHRDLDTGQITDTTVTIPKGAGNKFLVIDDICDGGRTFVGIADAIKETRPDAEIYLIVTHGIFSAGYSQLATRFNLIYTTNSYRDFDGDGIVKPLSVI